jgi:hypothetical protein
VQDVKKRKHQQRTKEEDQNKKKQKNEEVEEEDEDEGARAYMMVGVDVLLEFLRVQLATLILNMGQTPRILCCSQHRGNKQAHTRHESDRPTHPLLLIAQREQTNTHKT